MLVNLSAAKNLTAIFARTNTNPCNPDNVPPTFANCPPNISLKTLSSCANATWTAPTASDNCTATPSVSSNFTSGFCFPKGTTAVTYTATDAANNRTTCSFTVAVADSTPIQTGTCQRFTAANVLNLCGCVVPTYQPYALLLEKTGASCLGTLYQNENLILEQTSPTTATLKGRLRGTDWTPMDMDIQLTGGNSTTTPVRIQCLAGLPLSVTNGWFYYTQMTGTVKIGAAAPLSISLFNTPFQIGRGANQQNANLNGASAKFRLSNGEIGWLQFLFNTETAIACSGGGGTDPCATDNIAPIFTNCPQNINLTSNTNCAAAVWTAPTATDNCTATPSVSSNFLSGFCFPIGTNTVTYTATDSRNNTKMCSFTVTVQQASTLSDLALSLAANSPNYTIYTVSTFTLTAKNQGTTPFSNVKINFPFPTKTAKGGDALPTLGSWTEYCFGGVPCFEWTIPSLAAGATATLTVPLFIQNATTTITTTATLKSSTPTDNIIANNTASLGINPVPLIQRLVAQQPTQINPVVIQALYPNPTVQELTLDLMCLTEKEVTFNIYNTLGEVVLSKTRLLKKGHHSRDV